MAWARRLRVARDDERGSVSLYVVVIFLAVFSAAGIVIDGGYAIAARQKAANVAEQAARAGADVLSKNSLRSGGPVSVTPELARAAAEKYLKDSNMSGTVDPNAGGGVVTVTVQIAQPTTILSVFGINTITVTGRATARTVRGITTEDG